MPPELPEPQLAQREPEWTKWFTEEDLGFDLARLEKISDKRVTPPDAYDHLQVWRGFGPQTNEFYVQAATYSGRPVFFVVLEPSRFAPTSAATTPDVYRIMSWMYLVVIGGAVVLAWRNLRLRRSDRRGAFRVAFYFFCLGLLITAIHAHHTLSNSGRRGL